MRYAAGFRLGRGRGPGPEVRKIARKSLLYPRIKRDTVIIYCLYDHISLVDTEIIPADLNLPALGGRDQ